MGAGSNVIAAEVALARRAIYDRLDARVPLPSDLLVQWERTASGQRRIMDSEWAHALSDRDGLHRYGVAALAQGSRAFLSWLSPKVDAIDAVFIARTSEGAGRSCSWIGHDPARWWYRRIPDDPKIASMFYPISDGPVGDLAGLVNQYPAQPSAAVVAELTHLAPMEPLTGKSLVAANLVGVDLTGVSLAGADLSGAVLTGAVLVGCDFAGARLDGADLTLVDASGADLTGASMVGCRLDASRMARSILDRANLTNVVARHARLPQASIRNAVVTGADFTRASLAEADLRGTDVKSAIGLDGKKGQLSRARL